MDDTYEGASVRGGGAWAQPVHTVALSSPRTPQAGVGRRTLTVAITSASVQQSPGIGSPGTPKPMTPQSAQSSLLALEARSTRNDTGVPLRQKQQMQHLRLDIGAEDKWRRLGARVLPVFNGDGVVGAVEENTEIVRTCLRSEGEAAWPEVHSVLRMGMSSLVRSLYTHLGVAPCFEPSDRRPFPRAAAPVLATVLSIGGIAAHENVYALVPAIASVWATMYSHALPYIEGVFLPLAQFAAASGLSATRPPTVRHVALVHFRDAIAVPLLARIDDAVVLARTQGAGGCPGDPWAYYQSLSIVLQMLTVLVALTPGERGHLYDTAKALSLALQA
ncbi:hypothetical protein EV175_000162 [Coemansia sp. RSA 1933]|nr:hypothetical protein EV175_000162 [Coemansia sp. RSA 1933]